MSFTFYLTHKKLSEVSAGGPHLEEFWVGTSGIGKIYQMIPGLVYSEETELPWPTIYRWRTAFACIDALRPMSHELYPAKDPSPGECDGYWYLRDGDEYDADDNPVKVDPIVLREDTEIISKIYRVFAKFIYDNRECPGSIVYDINDRISVYWFDSVRRFLEWLEEAIAEHELNPEFKVYYYAG